MRRLAFLLPSWLFFASAVLAQSVPLPGFPPGVFDNRAALAPAGVSYTGPGNVVSGASAWWGLRAYNAADLGNNLINVCNPGDGACVNMVSSASTGALVVTTVGGEACSFAVSSGSYVSATGVTTLTIATSTNLAIGLPFALTSLSGTGSFSGLAQQWSAGSGTTGTTVIFTGPTGLGTVTITSGTISQCTIKTWYDRSGASACSGVCDATQATPQDRAVLAMNCLGSSPCASISFDSAAYIHSALGNLASSITAPYSASAIMLHFAAAGSDQAALIAGGTFDPRVGFPGTANIAYINAGANVSASATDNVFHATQAVFTGSASSVLSLDNAETTGNPGTDIPTSGNPFHIMGTALGYEGEFIEGGWWPLGFSSGQRTSMCHNQFTFWGTCNLMLKIVIVLALALLASPAHARGHGQQAPMVVCNFITGQATGVGAGTCVTDLPVCDGAHATADTLAFSDFNTWANGWQSTPHTGLIALTVNAGKNCTINDIGGPIVTPGLLNVRIVGYGATLSGTNSFYLANVGQFQDTNHSTRLFTAHAGDTTIQVNPSSASQPTACNSNSTCTGLFSAPGWALITGVDLENGMGFPSDPAFFQYIQITAINSSTGVITFTPPLLHDYLSTWPNYGFASGVDDGGPATLYVFHSSWNATVEWQGFTFTSTNQMGCNSKDFTLRDTTFTVSGAGGPIPSADAAYQVVNSNLAGTILEYDKMVQSGRFVNSTVGSFNMHSANANTFFEHSTVSAIVGTSANMTITNSSAFGTIAMGPALGRANTLTIFQFQRECIGRGKRAFYR